MRTVTLCSEEGRAALVPAPPLVDGALASLLSLPARQDCPGLWLPEASKNQEHFAQKIQYSLKFEISVSNEENIQFPYSHRQTSGPFAEGMAVILKGRR